VIENVIISRLYSEASLSKVSVSSGAALAAERIHHFLVDLNFKSVLKTPAAAVAIKLMLPGFQRAIDKDEEGLTTNERYDTRVSLSAAFPCIREGNKNDTATTR
jgi:hypothetical protein